MSEKTPAASFVDLLVWQKSHALAVSAPANIAEGFKRRGRMDKVRFLNIAAASLAELRYYLILAADLGYLPRETQTAEVDEVARMLSAYERTILWSARTQAARTVIATSVFCILYSVFSVF